MSSLPYSLQRQIQIMSNDNSLSTENIPPITALPLFSRVVHHICVHSVSPRDPHNHRLKGSDLFFTSLLLSRTKINLPACMITHMSEVHSNNLSLPYGGFLTHIFSHFGVDFSNEESWLGEAFNFATLGRLGFFIFRPRFKEN